MTRLCLIAPLLTVTLGLSLACDQSDSASPTAPSELAAAQGVPGSQLGPVASDALAPSVPDHAGPEAGDPATPAVPSGEPTTNDKIEIEGLVEVIDGTMLVVRGTTVLTTPDTIFRHGSRRMTLADVEVGDRVHIRAVPNATEDLEAIEVKIQRPSTKEKSGSPDGKSASTAKSASDTKSASGAKSRSGTKSASAGGRS